MLRLQSNVKLEATDIVAITNIPMSVRRMFELESDVFIGGYIYQNGNKFYANMNSI